MVTDFGAHMFDIVQWALNQDQTGPTEYKPPITPSNIGLSFRYQNGVEVVIESGVEVIMKSNS